MSPAATNVLTEKLGNTGLFKGAYGGGWLKDPVVGTLGKLAYSAVGEAGEEFAEGLFDPVLRRFTYDEDASYDDDWFRETMYETAMGAVLGGIGGAVDVGDVRDVRAERTAAVDIDTESIRKQKAPASETETERAPLRVGRVTTIQRPYTGPTPMQIQKSEVVPEVSAASVKKAEENIRLARQEEQANGGKGGKGFKTSLTELLFNTFSRSPGVPVSGMNFQGKPYLVEIGNNVPGKIASDRNLSAEKLAVLDVLPEVVRNSEYVGSGEYVPHSAKQKPTVRFDYFETETKIGGKPYIVSFDVEVFLNQNNYRTHKINKINEIELSPASNADPGPSARRK